MTRFTRCAPSGPAGDPDECNPPAGDPDYQFPGPGQDACDPQAGDPALCNPGPITAEPDVCLPPEGDPDECDLAFNDPDECLAPPADICTSLPEPDYPVPTAVEMAAFKAGWTGQGVVVEWETASELDSQAQPNTVYYYVIETLDTQGRADRYGPVQANPLRRLLPTRRRPAAGGPDLQSR